MSELTEHQILLNKLNQETAKMQWQELQPFFAAGQTVYVDAGLDLIEIAAEFSYDNKAFLEPLINAGKMAVVNEAQAATWAEHNINLWTVVVAPWVLVQPIITAEH